MGNIIDITGQKFNHLYVISHAFNKSGRSYWNCLCDCGKTVVVLGASLKNGNTKACGCHQKDGWRNGVTHGKSNTRQYKIWQNMKNRCSNEKDKYFKNYGGKGINVSIVLKNLGIDSKALGFVAGFTGKEIQEGVASMGIDVDFITIY